MIKRSTPLSAHLHNPSLTRHRLKWLLDLTSFHILEGSDAVRKRPGMYIGSSGFRSLHHLVKMKVSISLKLMRGASTRTRKLARDMFLFWKRVDKEMVKNF
ncbi:hypothetical protein L1887_04349 [Cichorium endivia]|nr:hypothetical protein L1887_04349 [Cichorium endivia]